MIKEKWGTLVTERRIELGFSLRKFCNKFGYDPGNLSKMERGLLLPPKGKKLEQLAKDLLLTEHKPKNCFDTWELESRFRFFELAEMERQPLYRQIKELKLEIEALKAKIAKFIYDEGDKWCTIILSWERKD